VVPRPGLTHGFAARPGSRLLRLVRRAARSLTRLRRRLLGRPAGAAQPGE
jgi:hypothetical protein